MNDRPTIPSELHPFEVTSKTILHHPFNNSSLSRRADLIDSQSCLKCSTCAMVRIVKNRTESPIYPSPFFQDQSLRAQSLQAQSKFNSQSIQYIRSCQLLSIFFVVFNGISRPWLPGQAQS